MSDQIKDITSMWQAAKSTSPIESINTEQIIAKAEDLKKIYAD